MCGIAGYLVNRHERVEPEWISTLLRSIRQRGPDDEGVCRISRPDRRIWRYATERSSPAVTSQCDHYAAAGPAHDTALLHTRYSIIDLNDRSHQPFVSRDGSTCAVFNGEIYNYLEVRAQLESAGVQFRTSSDTEVLVEGYALWKDEVWQHLNGFWAVALYDRSDGSIVLSRDRLGLAPLYYYDAGQGFFFASSLRSLAELNSQSAEVSHAAATGYIQTGLKDFHNQTCFRHIHSLPPGSWARFPLGVSRLAEAQTETFWRLPGERLSEQDRSFPETVAEFRETFINAVDLRLRADVPVGFELSGGLDSSSVVAVACQLRNNDLTTYTVKVPGFDEEPYARALSETYPFDYRVLDNPEGSLLAELDAFADIIQEPFHSPNIYSQFQIRRLLKADGVGVVLTGGGADEVLAGYQRLLEGAMQALLQQGQHARVTNHLFQRRWGDASLATRTLQAHRYLGGYLRRRCRRQPDRQSVPDSTHRDRRDAQALSASYVALPFHQQQLYQFQVGQLPYYLRNNDHFTMAIPVEQRFPFLDHRLVELGLRAPVSYLFKNGWTKYLLRKAMEPFLPDKILWRREKMGFPFALERFLSEHREVLAPLLAVVQQAGLDAPTADQYDDGCRRRRSAAQLWRACSTGLWLRNVAHWSQPAVAHA